MMDCKIRKYHNGRLLSYLQSFDRQISQANSSLVVLIRIRGQLESSNVIGELTIKSKSMKAAVFPVLNSWAYMHFKLYRLLISHGEPLHEKYDEWVIFYAQLILRYWRPYKDQLLIDFTEEDRSRYRLDTLQNVATLLSPAESILKSWSMLPLTESVRKLMKNMLDSCKVKRVLPVMFRYMWNNNLYWGYDYMTFNLKEEEEWLSCSDRGEKCVHKPCPELTTNTTGSKCFSENFSLFSKHSKNHPISSGETINILNTNGYCLIKTVDGTGLSIHFETDYCPDSPNPLKTSTLQNWLTYQNMTNWFLSKNLDSSILDNLYLVHMIADLHDYGNIDNRFNSLNKKCYAWRNRSWRGKCKSEAFKLQKMHRNGKSELYDGNIVFFKNWVEAKRMFFYYDIYVHGAETTKSEVPKEPTW